MLAGSVAAMGRAKEIMTLKVGFFFGTDLSENLPWNSFFRNIAPFIFFSNSEDEGSSTVLPVECGDSHWLIRAIVQPDASCRWIKHDNEVIKRNHTPLVLVDPLVCVNWFFVSLTIFTVSPLINGWLVDRHSIFHRGYK